MVTQRKRNGLKAAFGGALVALLALGGAHAAHAQSTIDPAETGSITVHKHQQSQDPSTAEGTGLEQAIDSNVHPPLQNIEFTAYAIDGVNLATNQGWQDLAALNASFDPYAAPDYGLGASLGSQVDQGRTDDSGELTFGDLAVGAYLVVESDWSAPLDAHGDPIEGGVTPSLPFLITVPMTHPENLDAWIYDVHVYPKNAISTVTKTVEDADAVKLGNTIAYTIIGDIPSGVTHDAYRIRDTFDAKLSYVSSDVYLVNSAGETLLVEGVDYEIDQNGQVVDVDITGAIGELVDYYQVKVVHAATVREAGEIENQPVLFPNAHAIDTNTPTPGTGVETKFGNIVIEKQNEANEPLDGAKFSVYLTEADARTGTNAIEIDGETEFESDDHGIVLISGLRYSDFANGVELDEADADYRTYWIAEVEAPAGYELLAHPIEVVVNSLTESVPTETVVNVPKNAGFELPITGGTGSTMLVLGGLVLALAGGALLVARKRVNA